MLLHVRFLIVACRMLRPPQRKAHVYGMVGIPLVTVINSERLAILDRDRGSVVALASSGASRLWFGFAQKDAVANSSDRGAENWRQPEHPKLREGPAADE